MAKKKDNQKPKVHPDLQGFDIKIDDFGQMHTSLPIEKLNEFLNKNVDDKKLKNRNDLKEGKEE